MTYLKQEFTDYLLNIDHNNSPNVYCSQLNGIEKNLAVNIDAEYQKDTFESLQKKLDHLYKHPEEIGKSKDYIKQCKSGLNKYKAFREWKTAGGPREAENYPAIYSPQWFYETAQAPEYRAYDKKAAELREKFVAEYGPDALASINGKALLLKMFNGEVENKENLFYILEFHSDYRKLFGSIAGGSSFKFGLFYHKKKNCWISGSPAKQIILTESEAIEKATAIRDNLINGVKIIQSYGDINTIEDYEQLYSQLKVVDGINTVWVLKYFQMIFPEVLPVFYSKSIQQDILTFLNIKPLNDPFARMGQINLFIKECGISAPVFSQIYYAINADAGDKEHLDYWPSPEEYNPNLTKEDWKHYIEEVELPNHPSPMEMLKAMMELGGEATCAKLAQVYGGHATRYIGCAVNLGKRAKQYFNLPACIDKDQERFFPIPFLGRDVKENGTKVYSYRIRPELLEALEEIDLSGIDPYNPVGYDNDEPTVPETTTDVPLNTILYGPPGTGKTYHTVIYAVAIVEGKELAVVEAEAKENYDAVFARYNAYKKQSYIEFTTFHQSYGYEEFIEGIKPVANESSGIEYRVEDGIFKAFCAHAQLPQSYDINPDAKIWRVVLGNGNLVTSNPTKFDCFNGNKIAFNWNAQEDHIGTYNYNQITHFRERINIGDVVVSYAGNGTDIDRIGIVTGDAVYDEKQHSCKWSRSVKWLDWIHPHHPINIKALNGNKYFDNDMLQHLKRVSLSELIKLLRPIGISAPGKNHVFIIDEINRGNISKIFGELITLIEPSKRVGAAEEMTAVLPYSQQPFGVPNNVYIIGTMNTADRSIAAIDTALRRRFQFREMMPNADVLAGITVDGISISDMLTRMNKRIEVLYDREHTIGHAYFMPLKDSPTVETLASIFSNSIIPLLQEYFYEDYEKIRLVLGDNRKTDDSITFITRKQDSYADLFGTMELDLDEGYTYEINKAAFGSIESYKTI